MVNKASFSFNIYEPNFMKQHEMCCIYFAAVKRLVKELGDGDIKSGRYILSVEKFIETDKECANNNE